MKLFILYQTDKWKTKSSRIFFGVFDCRKKAQDYAKYHKLEMGDSKIIIEEAVLNQCSEF